ncbi:LacI family DNA-binding transcriptional regulator [Paraburkholderia sp. DHOC27]|uniref:LacI family DNA-binding transcriptional regulator n=1 Tax=Paraburkholderia sp. DHOC27 TaxID=2303330 RepID=UPI000E3CCB0E|nr:LacI family DNA-binding transcriptional regulator [Paraburkholderia sp. DHOC27]RFU45028.1 LacI family transcriptional regulator [Paraburkholderia sp. DHOC27]
MGARLLQTLWHYSYRLCNSATHAERKRSLVSTLRRNAALSAPRASLGMHAVKRDVTMKSVTITDVAKRAGVSMKTVSRVLNNEPYVNERTRELVLSAATELGYAPNPSAQNLARGVSHTIGLVYAPAVAGAGAVIPHYSQGIQSGALDACERLDFGLLLLPCARDNPDPGLEIVRQARSRRLSALIVAAPVCNLPGVAHALQASQIPYFCVSPDVLEDGIGSVSVNDRQAARRMTEHILSLGHRRIAFVRGPHLSRDSDERLAGYLEAMQRAGVIVDPRWVVTGNHMFESGLACGKDLMTLEPRPTAVFASNDDMAAGVMHAAYGLGLSLPADVSVAGFDDSDIARTVWPPLTTIHQPLLEMAAKAVDALVAEVKDRGAGDYVSSLKPFIFDCTLMIRGSVAALSHPDD